MAFSRISAVRTAFRLSRSTRPILSKPQRWQRIGQRGYASSDHGTATTSSDLPWQIGALVSTGAGCAWLLSGEQPKPHGDHGDHHGEEHEEHEEESAEAKEDGDSEKPEDGEQEPKEEAKEESKEDSTGDDSGSDSGADTPDTSDDEGDNNTRKSIPDAKGGNKKRIESNNAIKQGEEQDTAESSIKDKPATSKEPGDKNTMSGKQEGLSNTDTKHSTDITNTEEKSTKGEGVPETAKVKGTVDPNRPQDGQES